MASAVSQERSLEIVLNRASSTVSLKAVELRSPRCGWKLEPGALCAHCQKHPDNEIDRLRQRLESENAYLRQELREAARDVEILGGGAAIRRVLEQIGLVAPTGVMVLLLGETGVGKELVARDIHEPSSRREGAMIKLNCSTIPRELSESELFGHVKGAFSGALADRIGRF